jgi:hypothetical protein
MSFLYQVDKPMRVNDYHEKIVDSADTEAAFLGVLPNGPVPKELKDTWPVSRAPVIAKPEALDGADKTTGWGNTVPLTLEGVCEIMASTGWAVARVSSKLRAAWEKMMQSAAFQRAEDAKAFALSIQRMLLSNQECRVASGGTAGRTRCVFSWLSPNAHAVDGITEVPAELRPAAAQYYSGAFDDFTEASFKAQLMAAYDKRRSPVTLTGYVGIQLKAKMSLWNELVPVTASLDSARSIAKKADALELMVDVFKYDMGTVRTLVQNDLMCDMDQSDMPHTYQTPRSGAFLDLAMWNLAWLERIEHMDGIDQGGGPRGHHFATGRLNCLNPAWQCAVVPASPAA